MNSLSVANHFPIYFRPPTILVLVWGLWGINVYVFRRFGINYCELLNLDAAATLSPRSIVSSALLMFAFICLFALGFYFHWPFHDALLFPSTMYLTGTFLFLAPVNALNRAGREKLLHNMARVCFPATLTGVLFVEVLLGDILTSIAKLLADIEVTGCVMAAHLVTLPSDHHDLLHDPTVLANIASSSSSSGSSSPFSAAAVSTPLGMRGYFNGPHEQECADSWMRPFVTSVPFLLRFRQCWIQYRLTGRAFPHLMNCAKYFSSLPVIWISALTQREGHFSRELRAAWILAVSVNSFMSFMWDIVMDWGLCRQGAKHFLLRETLVFAWPMPLRNPSSLQQQQQQQQQVSGTGGAATTRVRLMRGGDKSSSSMNGGSARLRTTGGDGEGMIAAAQDGGENDSPGSATGGVVDGLADFSSSSSSSSSSSNSILISVLGKSSYLVYYVAIGLNFVLRILWSFKLSVHFQLSQEGLTFVLEICEVFRRFVWILFRVEWEAIERGQFITLYSELPRPHALTGPSTLVVDDVAVSGPMSFPVSLNHTSGTMSSGLVVNTSHSMATAAASTSTSSSSSSSLWSSFTRFVTGAGGGGRGGDERVGDDAFSYPHHHAIPPIQPKKSPRPLPGAANGANVLLPLSTAAGQAHPLTLNEHHRHPVVVGGGNSASIPPPAPSATGMVTKKKKLDWSPMRPTKPGGTVVGSPSPGLSIAPAEEADVLVSSGGGYLRPRKESDRN